MTSSDSSYESLGPALVALKLFIVLAGVIAAMRDAPAPDGREYADRLMTAAQRQSAEWAEGGREGRAEEDLQKTIDSLRGQLSAEELAALLKDLQGGANAGGPADAQAPRRNPRGNNFPRGMTYPRRRAARIFCVTAKLPAASLLLRALGVPLRCAGRRPPPQASTSRFASQMPQL